MKLKHFETFTVFKCFCKFGISKYILRLWKIKMICLHKPRKTKFYSFPQCIKLRIYFSCTFQCTPLHTRLSAGASCARLPDLHANVWLNVLLFYIMHFFPSCRSITWCTRQKQGGGGNPPPPFFSFFFFFSWSVVKIWGKRAKQDDITIAGFN